MEDSVIKIPRQSCCRLCLAPESECVSIFATRAADKQPISTKIQACVNIQVNATDRLSGKICHYCISFLNSWTSFKGRCVSAQKRQKTWLATQLQRQLGLQASTEGLDLATGNGDSLQPMDTDAPEAYNYYPQYQRKASKVSSDAKDDDDSGPLTMELDPSQFLAAAAGDDDDDEDADDDDLEEGEFVPSDRNNGNRMSNGAPQILNALGLRTVNPMSMLATDMGDDEGTENGEDQDGSVVAPATGSCRCRVCGMEFSNRANARRHERNRHGIRAQALQEANKDSGGAAQNNHSNNNNSINNSQGLNKLNRSVASPAPSNDKKPPVPREASKFDYSNPALHRHLLTDARILFIRRNARFLHQYQNMTCNCCDRQYFTYKTFMAHMRKKYPSLPRNVCFNCLRKFETKGQFIAHLKKRNCINLFTLFMADDTIAKDARLLAVLEKGGGGGAGDLSALALSKLTTASGERLGLKDLLSNKVYACRLCQEQLRLKSDFRHHVNTAHPELQGVRDPVTGNCRYCHATFSDTVERKRHFSGQDCMLLIICMTCDMQFPTNAKFLDHVYGTHLKQLNALERQQMSTGERAGEDKSLLANNNNINNNNNNNNNHNSHLMPKKNAGCVCPVCQKHYNNYYNVLWHFESKHPELVPKTYKCELCEQMFTKQALLKSHVKETHSDVLVATEPKQADSASGKYGCRHCEEVLGSAAEYVAHQLSAHPEEELLACHECEFVTEERDKLEEHLRQQHLSVNLKMRVLSCATCKQSFVTTDALKYHTMVQHAENESSEQLFKRLLKFGHFPAAAAVKKEEARREEELIENEGDEEGEEDLLQDTSYMARVKYEESQRVRECPLCAVKYEVLAEFIEHMNGHVATDGVTNLDLEPGKSKSGAYHSRMRCRMCEKRISSKVGYKRHLLEEHGVNDCKIVQCDLCPGEFSNDKGLKAHLFRTHNIIVKDDGEVMTGGQSGDSLQVSIKKETIEYECQICHIVYRSLSLLRSHVSSVHQQNDFDAYLEQYGNGEITTTSQGGDDQQQQQQLDAMSLMMMSSLMDGDEPGLSGGGTDYTPIEVYFQCRYCDENFASRQKLTAHMNTHEEHDPHDYTCRECGNVYQSRKSLWVHRNKKHPRSQVPSPCEVCKKVFFDKTELVYHLKTHVAQKMELMNELMSAAQNGGLEDVDDDEDEEHGEQRESGSEGEETSSGQVNGVKKYDCHVCERKFKDPGKLSQHLRFHEMQNNMFVLGAFTEAGMDDDDGAGTGSGANGAGGNEATGGDPFEPQYNEDGQEEYQCDMCPKKFNQLMALRVHRGWHYRSPDGRQITEPGQTWQPGSVRSQRGKNNSQRSSTTSQEVANNNGGVGNKSAVPVTAVAAVAVPGQRLPKCQYCSSTFASSNNLRRHIVEVHKRQDFRAQQLQQQQQKGSGRKVDREKECAACNLTFETRAEWVEHKMGHARVMRPSTTFEWNCQMCGKVFTRKERLLQHMASHASEGSGKDSNENSRGTTENGDFNEEEEEDEDVEEDEEDDMPMVVNPDVEMLNEDDDDDDEEEEEEEEQKEKEEEKVVKKEKEKPLNSQESGASKKSLQCDLCQKEFGDDLELRKHVMSHFFNGGGGEAPVTTTAVKTKKKDDADKADSAAPLAKRAKVDIPEQQQQKKKREEEPVTVAKEEEEDVEMEPLELGEEEEDEGEVVEGPPQPAEESMAGGDLTAGDVEGGDEDLDEGEYVEEYFDEESIVSPKKPSPAKPTVVVPARVVAPVVVIPKTAMANCRVCSSSYENNFKALKCMESHRQRSKYQCGECELYFGTPKQLQGHQQLMHGGVTVG